MKVKMSDYPKWYYSSIYDKWMMYRYGERNLLKNDSPRGFDRLVYILDDVIQSFLNITINKLQEGKDRKISVKISNHDLYAADHTLTEIILPMLRMIKIEKQGAPFVEFDDVPPHLVPSEKEVEESKELGQPDLYHFDRWNYVIDEMIFAFEHIKDDSWIDEFYHGEIDFIESPCKINGDPCDESEAEAWISTPSEHHTFWFDKEGYEVIDKRVRNGLRLFASYFRNLGI
jgi:hypothetical protein